jgi:hypothetical protein
MASARPVPLRQRRRSAATLPPICVLSSNEIFELMPAVRARFIEPMLLQLATKLPEGAQWLYELKLDGYRAGEFRPGSHPRRHRGIYSSAMLCCTSDVPAVSL